ncbi:MAG: ferric reductase-like transmembrane domain-containing protein [Alphaproteobacteria bacterium]|nr:ferric reductase-like transmembrane domain-containing protein [Alphaproteobacteria bacterium]
MGGLARVWHSPYAFMALLSLPAAVMAAALGGGGASAQRLLDPTGEFAARFLILALMVTPLGRLWPGARWVGWLLRRRRMLGVAAFAYAAAHLALYVKDMETLRAIAAEFWVLGIWTGWAALLLFLPLAATSNDAAQAWLKRRWAQLHRLVYPAAILTLVHWIFVHNNLIAALAHFAPLALLEALRIAKTLKRPNANTARRSRGAVTERIS